ncbi:Gp37 protein [Gallibacterium anatis UMN179]|uniref:Gp37 protein n=1 Tax=Gallibacterium anatis (strain UMN179) TaxID=1005058 RepID=F4HC81_GALAU|nr:Gp37 family protein [Gallibacterium anatis]AEC17642.1 Gp37 protein [Gallibacterium anatis UMN179]
MSATLPILTAIQQQLTAALPDWQVELMPDDPSDYYLAHPNGAVLIGYVGSTFGALRASDVVSQTRKLRLMLTVISRNLHNDNGALAVLDQLRLSIAGFQPPNCGKCYLISEQFNDEESGIWQYQLQFEVETVQLEQLNPQHKPKFVEAILRRQGQPLDKKLTPKKGEN